MTLVSVNAGDRFHKLVAVRRSSRNGKLWVCLCDCGREIRVYESHLLNKKKLSCCERKQSNRKDYSGQVFGYLTALSFIRQEPNGNSVWSFRCNCGRTVERIMRQAVQGMLQSCGCMKAELCRRKATLPPGESIKNSAFKTHVKTAENRQIKTELTKDQYLSITEKPCHYCGAFSERTNPRTNETIKMNSVDRLNNEPYYRLSNAVPACFICQHMKSSYPERVFLDKISKIHTFRRLSGVP